MSREGQEKASDTQERTVDRLVLFIDYLRAKNIVKNKYDFEKHNLFDYILLKLNNLYLLNNIVARIVARI